MLSAAFDHVADDPLAMRYRHPTDIRHDTDTTSARYITWNHATGLLQLYSS